MREDDPFDDGPSTDFNDLVGGGGVDGEQEHHHLNHLSSHHNDENHELNFQQVKSKKMRLERSNSVTVFNVVNNVRFEAKPDHLCVKFATLTKQH